MTGKIMISLMQDTLDKANSKYKQRAHHIAHQITHLGVHQRTI